MEFSKGLIIEIALIPSGTVSLNQSMCQIKWEVEKATKVVREMKAKRKEQITLQIVDLNQKALEEEVNTMSIKQQLMELRLSSERPQLVDL
jgi:hypothetical protein